MAKVLFVVTSEDVETKLGIKDLELIPSKNQHQTFDGINYTVTNVKYITPETDIDGLDAKIELVRFAEPKPEVDVW